MAHDSTFRSTRPSSAIRRAGKPGGSSDDPLAELARLIGKNDPYAQFGLNEQHSEQQEESDPSVHYAHESSDCEGYYGSSAQRGYEPGYGERYEHSAHQYEQDPDVPAAHAPRDEQWALGDRYEYSDPPFETAAAQPAYAHPDDGEEQDAHATEQPYQSGDFEDADQIYDDPPRGRRHGGLATALALIGCAVLGTAGAYAYRSYYSPPVSAQAPPVITADTSTPTKVIPAPAGDTQAGKIVQDRLANAGKEQVISKQEEPIALKDLGTAAAPRVVLPAPVAPTPSTTAPQQPSTSSVHGANEPKKVHTLTIRPDGSDVSGQPVAGSASPARGTTPEARGSGPLSLAPEQSPAPAIPAPRTRTATAPAPSRSEPASISASSSGFLVQLSSQKTEAEATASFRSLQAKFPNELAGRRPIIRRADLGTKGVFYRTMVGPFGSAQEANEFCASYKTAGGHCVVPSH